MVCCDLCIIKMISMLDSYESDVISIIPQQKKKKNCVPKIALWKNDAVKLFKVHGRYNGW